MQSDESVWYTRLLRIAIERHDNGDDPGGAYLYGTVGRLETKTAELQICWTFTIGCLQLNSTQLIPTPSLVRLIVARPQLREDLACIEIMLAKGRAASPKTDPIACS